MRPDRTRSRGGFSSKSDAADFLDERVKEVSALRRGDLPAIRRRDMPTLRQLVDEYLAQYSHEANSEKTARYSLKRALDKWGEIPVNRIASTEVRAWRRSLPERSAWQYHKTLRAVLNYAVATKLLDENPAAAVPNPRTKPREVQAFESWEQIEAVAEELGDQYGAIPLFVAATGLRPEEWVALERRDVDRQAGVVHVRRVYTDGTLKTYAKTSNSLRAVPLPARALQALSAAPARLDTPLLFPGPRGGHLNMAHFRRLDWNPAISAAALEHRTPYALRHTYATFAIAAGVPTFHVARFMGTSLEQIDRTYGHLLPTAIDQTRQTLDAFFAAAPAQAAEGLGT